MINVKVKKGWVEGEWDYARIAGSETIPEMEGLGLGYFLEFSQKSRCYSKNI